MKERILLLAVMAIALSCAGGTDPVTGLDRDPDVVQDGFAAELQPVDLSGESDFESKSETTVEELVDPDLKTDLGGQECEPGEGCFLDKCGENSDCLSGWCVEHLGEGVCTVQCTEECPPGWSCKQVAGTDPDVVYVCVSDVANLCRPCATGDSCAGAGGTEAVCVDYGLEGSFCGSACAADDDCPWGFLCSDVVTVNGIGTSQCVAEAGVCPCTGKSVALALSTPCTSENEFGACTGQRVCTEDGLSDCDAALPQPESCDGEDNDCDGEVDEPVLLEGKYLELCDDGNACTVDSCLGQAGCQHEALDGGECADGDACTVGDHCEEGACVGLPVVCDDGNPCTDDFCDGVGGCTTDFNSAACDDGDPCTVADQCVAGECVGYGVDCDCQQDSDCAALEDGDLCNGTLVCSMEKLPYQCVVDPATVVVCPLPEGPSAICLQAQCDPGTGSCGLVPDHEGMACEDGDGCTVGDHCVEGACLAGIDMNCNDGNACTDDLCDPNIGCQHVANQAACNDGDACTVGDVCSDGECQGGVPALCDDGNPCTDDTCDALQGCQHAPNQADCDLGNACTVGDHCEGGQCVFESLLVCNDDNPCTTDFCHPETGCQFQLNEAPCDDGDLCSTGDHCHLGECISSGELLCDDQNACTDDSCSPQTGCLFVFNSAPCDDGNPCTAGDACGQGSCQSGLPVDCDDGLFCNGEESCDPAVGCVTGDAPVLSDGIDCTLDSCDEENDVVLHVPVDTECDDGLFCNGAESCDAEAGCLAGDPPPVDDGIECTVDSCDEISDLVVHVPDDLLCDDGDPCNGVETCNPALGCLAGEPINCFFDEPGDRILLANGHFIKCFGGLSVTPTQVSCPYPLFDQLAASGNVNSNTMLGLHNEGEQYAAGHLWVLEQVGTTIGYAGNRTVTMNESGLGGLWSGTGTYENEHCYVDGQVLNWKQTAYCNGGLGGGSNVMSGFVLYK